MAGPLISLYTSIALLHAPLSVPSLTRCPAPRCAEGDSLFSAFANLFKEDPNAAARKEQQFREQQEILERRRNPKAREKYLRESEENRRVASREAADRIGWQQNPFQDPIKEWKKRKADDKVKPLGYEDVPKGGIQFPMASFGVGGEFGTGGKYDNGERFDLRLPYVDQGWVEGGDAAEDDAESVDFFANLLSGGKLQREADERRRNQGKSKGKSKGNK